MPETLEALSREQPGEADYRLGEIELVTFLEKASDVGTTVVAEEIQMGTGQPPEEDPGFTSND